MLSLLVLEGLLGLFAANNSYQQDSAKVHHPFVGSNGSYWTSKHGGTYSVHCTQVWYCFIAGGSALASPENLISSEISTFVRSIRIRVRFLPGTLYQGTS